MSGWSKQRRDKAYGINPQRFPKVIWGWDWWFLYGVLKQDKAFVFPVIKGRKVGIEG